MAPIRAISLGISDIREARGDLEHSNAELRSALELMPTNTEIHNRVLHEVSERDDRWILCWHKFNPTNRQH
ncbi:MAG: hypothetical protein K2Y22_08770 [Candidatus Obscuribacterales bacterium]|nr:hypothetical protein [Candidatus Obscuribacterales bacterium]